MKRLLSIQQQQENKKIENLNKKIQILNETKQNQENMEELKSLKRTIIIELS